MCEGGRRRTFTQFEFGAAEGRSPQATASLPLPCGPRCTLLPPEERADGGVGYSLTHSLFLYLSLSPYALLRSAPRVYIYIYRGVVIAVRVSSPHFLLVNSSVSLVSLHSCSGSSLAPVSRPLSRSFSPRGSVLALLVAHSFSFLRAAVWSAQLVGIHFRGRCRARRCGGGVVCEGGGGEGAETSQWSREEDRRWRRGRVFVFSLAFLRMGCFSRAFSLSTRSGYRVRPWRTAGRREMGGRGVGEERCER